MWINNTVISQFVILYMRNLNITPFNPHNTKRACISSSNSWEMAVKWLSEGLRARAWYRSYWRPCPPPLACAVHVRTARPVYPLDGKHWEVSFPEPVYSVACQLPYVRKLFKRVALSAFSCHCFPWRRPPPPYCGSELREALCPLRLRAAWQPFMLNSARSLFSFFFFFT